MYEEVCKKRRRCVPPFFRYSRKPVGVAKMTPTGRAKVKMTLKMKIKAVFVLSVLNLTLQQDLEEIWIRR